MICLDPYIFYILLRMSFIQCMYINVRGGISQLVLLQALRSLPLLLSLPVGVVIGLGVGHDLGTTIKGTS